MSKSHNKKRNVGLVYEFLVRYISRALVEGRQDDAESAVKILNRRFKPGTQIYSEFRLFNSLLTTTVSSANVVNSIITEARNAAKRVNLKKLDKEKSILIREINHGLRDPIFFKQQVPEYKIYATIQTLLNDWRAGGAVDIAKMATYEDGLTRWILREKVELPDLNDHKDKDVNTVVVDIMVEKLGQKYSGILTTPQRDLIKTYAASSHYGDGSDVSKMMKRVRSDALSAMREFTSTSDTDEILTEKLSKAVLLIESGNFTTVDDVTVENHLKFIKLVEELQS
jgi:hypothetical protein